jgi:low temperature requirement protein LtrA
MRHIFGSRPVMTEETHRATTSEIFFDLVFVFALTRIIAFMGQPPTPLTLAQGLLLLLLLYFSWMAYAWLGNQARADVGLIRAGTLVAMAAIFVIALVIPDAWRPGVGTVHAPLTLALAFIALRTLQLALYFHVLADDRRLRTALCLGAISATFAWTLLILGAVLGGAAQTPLWAAALVIDITGGRVATAVIGWQLRSPSHFAERHGLVLIIAFGESLTSVGAGAGSAVTRGTVLVAALLGFTTTVCLWWLYFENTAPAAGQAFGRAPSQRRAQLALDAYSLVHLALVAGVIYLALGIKQALAHEAHNQPGHPAGTPLDWTETVALYGGVTLYLTGRMIFLRLTLRSTPPGQIAAIGVALVLLPVARILPALAALGLLTAFLLALCCYVRFKWGERNPATGAPTVA